MPTHEWRESDLFEAIRRVARRAMFDEDFRQRATAPHKSDSSGSTQGPDWAIQQVREWGDLTPREFPSIIQDGEPSFVFVESGGSSPGEWVVVLPDAIEKASKTGGDGLGKVDPPCAEPPLTMGVPSPAAHWLFQSTA